MVNIQSNGKIVLVDSGYFPIEGGRHDSPGREGRYFPIFYIGKTTDSIFLGSKPVNMNYNNERDAKYDSARNWALPIHKNFSIVVDTSFNLMYKDSYTSDDGNEIVDSVKYFKAFPVFIINLSDSLLRMGTHDIVRPIICEAKDESGRWIEVDKRIEDLCGTAKRVIVLEPKNMLVAKYLLHNGDFKTECRLKFGRQNAVYSNSFNDYVDRKQLVSLH